MHMPTHKTLSLATIAAAAMFLTLPALAALKAGTTAPVFNAKGSLAGHEFNFSMRAALQKGPVVLYFFPSAFTKGCDVEAHTFATHKDDFDAADATIIGVSADNIQRLNAFSSDPDYCAGKFPVLSDADGKIAAAYGLEVIAGKPGMTDVRGKRIGHGFIPRTTFVIGHDGRIVATLSSQTDGLSPAAHVSKSLVIVQDLRAGK